MLVQFPYEEHEHLSEELPNEEVCMIKDREWHLVFDGPPMHQGGGVGIVLYALDGTDFLSHSSSSSFAQIIKPHVKFYS